MTIVEQDQAPAAAAPTTKEISVTFDEALTLAIRLQSTGNPAMALPIYQQAVDFEPDNPLLLHFMGVALHQCDRTAEGLPLIERSLELEPRNAGWWNNYGNVLRLVPSLDAAIDAYQRAVEIQPDFAEPYNNLGLVQDSKNNLSIAQACFEKAIELSPDFAEPHANLGNLLVRRGEVSRGVDLLFRGVTLAPHDLSSKRSLAFAYGEIGEYEKASAIYREWLEEEPDHPIALHHLAAISNKPPPRASDDYVRTLFDRFASTFEEKLGHLGYRAPELVNRTLLDWAGPSPGLRIADAGCGTGLCARGLRPAAQRLVGVDLSSAMLELATACGLYDELVEEELTAFLEARPGQFDAVVSADTLCYFGDLTPPLTAARASLRDGGAIVFTVEALADDATGLHLSHNGRYAHSRSAIETSLAQAGFAPISIVRGVLRSESGKDVEGLVVLAERRPA